MNFNRFFIGSSYSLLVISFAMLLATGRLGGLPLAMFVGVLAAGCLIDLGSLRWSLSRGWANALIIVWLVVALIEWRVFNSSPVSVVIHFALFAASLKLLRTKNNRDWLWLHVVSFCIVLMSAGMMMGTTFLLLLILYLLAAASTFIAFEIHRSQQAFDREIGSREVANSETGNRKVTVELWREVNDQRRVLPEPRSRSLFFFSAAAMFVILVLAAPLFFVVPRVTTGAGRNGLLQGEALSGFSDTVRLGEVAQVKLNPQVVMRVRVSFPNGQQNQSKEQSLRWRGVTLDNYDGQSWNNSGPDPLPIRRYGEGFRVEDHDYYRGFTEQQFFMEPLELRNVFAAPRAVLVTGVPDLSRDLGDGLWTEAYRLNKLNYSVYSDTSIPTDEALAADNSREYPRNIAQRYLQLPEKHDRRIDQLATQLTENAKTQIDAVRRIEHYLRTEFDYTLDLQRVEDGDPVADFLFNTRAGHCEYFASAMVLMLRARRIPARLVNGFQTGEYNRPADVFTVRQSDAHSWVEAYFPQSKWVAFDPTPAAGLSAYDGGLMAILRQYSEAMEMLWLEQVVAFDTSKQISMFMAAQSWMAAYQKNLSWKWTEWVRGLSQRFEFWRGSSVPEIPTGSQKTDGESKNFDWRSAASHPLTLAMLGIAVVGLVMLQRKRFFWSATKLNASESAIRFYREMLSALERAGHRRQPDQTPLEFASQIGMPAVSEITQLYQRQRFSNETLTNEETARIEMLLRDLKKSARQK